MVRRVEGVRRGRHALVTSRLQSNQFQPHQQQSLEARDACLLLPGPEENSHEPRTSQVKLQWHCQFK